MINSILTSTSRKYKKTLPKTQDNIKSYKLSQKLRALLIKNGRIIVQNFLKLLRISSKVTKNVDIYGNPKSPSK